MDHEGTGVVHNRVVPAGGGNGPRGLAAGLYRYGSLSAFRAAAPLPKLTQELFDRAVINVGRSRLVLVDDLISEGLVFPLPEWISTPTIYNEKIGRSGSAQRTMVPKARGERQVQDRSGYTIPIFCTWDDFSFDIRAVSAAERVGTPLEVSHIEEAARNCNESIEDQGINGLVSDTGVAINIDGNTAPGLLNAPNANTYAYAGGEAWDAAGHTGEEILTDMLAMIDKAQAARYYGPYNLYVPTTYGSKLNQDFKANGDKTIRQRLEEVEAGGRNIRVRVADQLPANRTVLVQMTSNVVDVIVGDYPTPVSWTDGPGWEFFSVVLSCIITRVKCDYENKSGIVLGYTS